VQRDRASCVCMSKYSLADGRSDVRMVKPSAARAEDHLNNAPPVGAGTGPSRRRLARRSLVAAAAAAERPR
jgi:hypothetical protein